MNKERICAVDCVAYEVSKLSNCRLVAGVERLLLAMRKPDRPVSSVAPRVTP